MEIILVILAIIGGISSLFKDKLTEQPKKNPDQPSRPTPPVPDSSQGKQEDQSRYEPSQKEIEMQEQRDSQMQQLAERMNVNTEENEEEHSVDLDNTLKEPTKEKKTPETDMEKRVRNNLNRQGLIDGIIMSEVLGSPRARKPHQSAITKRSE